jgi:hypothetical protein
MRELVEDDALRLRPEAARFAAVESFERPTVDGDLSGSASA